jgi:hypothetical protein
MKSYDFTILQLAQIILLGPFGLLIGPLVVEISAQTPTTDNRHDNSILLLKLKLLSSFITSLIVIFQFVSLELRPMISRVTSPRWAMPLDSHPLN